MTDWIRMIYNCEGDEEVKKLMLEQIYKNKFHIITSIHFMLIKLSQFKCKHKRRYPLSKFSPGERYFICANCGKQFMEVWH